MLPDADSLTAAIIHASAHQQLGETQQREESSCHKKKMHHGGEIKNAALEADLACSASD